MINEATTNSSAYATTRPTLTVAETAELLGVSTWLIHAQIKAGSLPAIHLGRRILVPRARLLAWLDEAS